MPFTAISTNQHALRHARADISKETIMNAFIHYLIQTKQTNLIAVEKKGGIVFKRAIHSRHKDDIFPILD